MDLRGAAEEGNIRIGVFSVSANVANSVAASFPMLGPNQDYSSVRSRRNARRGHPRIFATCESARPPRLANCSPIEDEPRVPADRRHAPPATNLPHEGTLRLLLSFAFIARQCTSAPASASASMSCSKAALASPNAPNTSGAVLSKVRRRASMWPTVPGAVPQYVWSVCLTFRTYLG